MYLQVKLGLTEIGKFTDGKLIDSEIAYGFDLAINSLISEILKNGLTENNTYFETLLQDLKFEKEESEYVVEHDSIEFNLPDYHVLLKLSLETKNYSTYNKAYLQIGKYYKPKTQAKINNLWVSTTTKATHKEYYGEIQEEKTRIIPIRLISSDRIDVYRKSNFSKSTNKSIISEKIDNKLVCYTDCKGTLKIVGYKKPIEFKTLNENLESPYNDLMNTFLIKEVINLNKTK